MTQRHSRTILVFYINGFPEALRLRVLCLGYSLPGRPRPLAGSLGDVTLGFLQGNRPNFKSPIHVAG